jgi:ribosomal protein S18 acetylase RimI-like enzyme
MKTTVSGVKIRPIKIWEIPELLHFRRQNDYNAPFENKDAESESALYSILKAFWHRERMLTLAAVKNGKFVGYASIVFGKHKKFRGNAYLVNMAVKGGERGGGIGTKMLSATEIEAHSRSVRRLELEVFASNLLAVKFYEGLGYKAEGVKKRVVENSHGFDDLIFMAKFLI